MKQSQGKVSFSINTGQFFRLVRGGAVLGPPPWYERYHRICTAPLPDYTGPRKYPFLSIRHFFAVVAVSVASFVTGHVAQIDIMDPFFKGQISELFECGDGRGRQSGQFILGKKILRNAGDNQDQAPLISSRTFV